MSAYDQLRELATILAVPDRQRREAAGGKIVCIAGWRGIVRPSEDGEALRLVAAHPDKLDDEARRRLAWAGVIARLTNRSFDLKRLPHNNDEIRDFRTLLGLDHGAAR